MRPPPPGVVVSGDPQVDKCVIVVQCDHEVAICEMVWTDSWNPGEWYAGWEASIYLSYEVFDKIVAAVRAHRAEREFEPVRVDCTPEQMAEVQTTCRKTST